MPQLTMIDAPIVVLGSKRKALLLFVGSGAFVAVGALLIPKGDIVGWLAVAFFGLCMAISVVLLLPGSTKLMIDSDGIHMTSMFRLTHIRWADVDSFFIGSIRAGLASTKMIGIKYSVEYQGQRAGRRVASAMSGMEGAIPNQYQSSAEDLCNLLNSAKRRWGMSPNTSLERTREK